jgi:vacuolar-type H+-ATPase subunit F/Vma7
MRVLVLGNADDARGFALAGATAIAPKSRRELETALAHATDVGLVLLSAEIAALAPRAVRAFVERPFAPPLLVLPAEPRAAGGPP